MNINRRDFLLGMAAGAGTTMLPTGYQLLSGPSIPYHQGLVARFNNEPPALCSSTYSDDTDMYSFHSDWHIRNCGPSNRAPNKYTDDLAYTGPEWSFGTQFLVMHHRMLEGIKQWYTVRGLALPPIAPDGWPADGSIPRALDYIPTMENVPGRYADNFSECGWKRQDESPNNLLLPSYFRPNTGAGNHSEEELNTGFTELNQFKNTNQLGCCLSFLHGIWHEQTIGGIAKDFGLSIVDPVFYFGIHALIDRVFLDWLNINGITISDVESENYCAQVACSPVISDHPPNNSSTPPSSSARLLTPREKEQIAAEDKAIDMLRYRTIRRITHDSAQRRP